MISEQSKYVIFLGGGGFAGAFGLGVLRGLREQGLRDHISAVYGASAGVLNGAHFLTGEEENYLPIFLDPSMGSLVHWGNIPRAIWHSFKYGITHDRKGVDVFDIEKKEQIYRERRTLDMQKLQSQSIPLYVSLYDFNNNQTEYVDIRPVSEPYSLIKATSAAAPFRGQTGFFEGKEYLDGAIQEPLPGEYLLQRFPNAKIIYILNNTQAKIEKGDLSSFLEKTFVSWWARLSLGQNTSRAYANRQQNLKEQYLLLKKNSRASVVTIPEEYSTAYFKSNPEKIARLFEAGYIKGKQMAATL